MPDPSRLLIVACSQRKKTDAHLLPAIQRYDGPAFRVLRRYFQNSTEPDVDLRVLSAKYGLIGGQDCIPHYDRSMDRQRAHELTPTVCQNLNEILADRQYNELCFCLSKSYQAVFDDPVLYTLGIPVQKLTGGQGTRLAWLYQWLYKTGAVTPNLPSYPSEFSSTASLEAIDKILFAIQDSGLPQSARSGSQWCVNVKGIWVPVKWAYSVLTRQPVSAFHTDKARRVLTEIGFPISYHEVNR